MYKLLRENRRKQIGILLQHERKCQGLGQVDVAQKFGERQEFISKIEASKRKIDVLELIEYAEALGFSLTEIAWKIETYLSGQNLLPLPNSNVLHKKFRVDVSWCENKLSAKIVDDLPGTIIFTANTFVELQTEIKERFEIYVKMVLETGYKGARWLVKNEYEFEYNFLDAISLLNAYNPYISLAAISNVSGINQNQLSQYANGLKKARPKQLQRIKEAIHEIGKVFSVVVV